MASSSPTPRLQPGVLSLLCFPLFFICKYLSTTPLFGLFFHSPRVCKSHSIDFILFIFYTPSTPMVSNLGSCMSQVFDKTFKWVEEWQYELELEHHHHQGASYFIKQPIAGLLLFKTSLSHQVKICQWQIFIQKASSESHFWYLHTNIVFSHLSLGLGHTTNFGQWDKQDTKRGLVSHRAWGSLSWIIAINMQRSSISPP